MGIISEYKNYLKNNPKGYWFRAKWYGWGWTPVTWQGWLVLVLYVAVLVKIFGRVDVNSHSGSDTLIMFSLPFLIATAILLAICWVKGERPRWNWGNPDKNTPTN